MSEVIMLLAETECLFLGLILCVSDIQVKVIPSTEGQTVTLMCSTSCPLTENPAAYIWYKNGEFLYEDWSPWYQELVSSDSAVTYSCAIRGYEDIRAPEVSVDSVTQICFSVTYAEGRMCSEQTSTNESCSITYPTEFHVQRTKGPPPQVRLTCNTTCPLTDAVTSLKSLNGNSYTGNDKELMVGIPSTDKIICAVKNHKDLNSAPVCVDDKNCWRVDYVSRRICALKGSSVNITCLYHYSDSFIPKSNNWYQTKREMKVLTEDGGKVQLDGRTRKNQHVLTLKNVQKNDSAEYHFNLKEFEGFVNPFGIPGVTLIVTDLNVKVTPSPEVTEGQRVTLTCSTSCPLTHNSNYTWFFNSEPLSSNKTHNKHLILDAVSHQHAGNYSCAVAAGSDISDTSAVKTLKVQTVKKMWEAAVTGVSAVLLFILLFILLSVFLCVRKKRTSTQPRGSAASSSLEQNADVSAGRAEEELQYSSVHFTRNTSPLYSLVQPHRPQEPEGSHYASINFKANTHPE